MSYSLVQVQPGQFDAQGRARAVRRCRHRHRTPEAADQCDAHMGGRAYEVRDNETDRPPEGWPNAPQHPWGD